MNFDRDTLDRARAAATYLARNEPDAGIRSLADIVNPAVADRVAQLEQRFNGGEPFQPVRKMPPGRPAGPHVGPAVHGESEVTLEAAAHPAGNSDDPDRR